MVVEALVIIIAVAACRWFNRRRGAGAPVDPLPGPPDPYALAWLRGGSTAVLQLAAYDLVRSARLGLVPAGQAAAAASAPARMPVLVALPARSGADDLHPAARRLLQLVTAPCDRPRLVGFAAELAPCFDSLERTLRADGLLLAPAQRVAGWAVTLLGMALVLGAAWWLLLGEAAAAQGSAVALGSLAAFGMAALLLGAAPEPRLSPRGRAYLVRRAGELEAATGARRGQRWIPAAAGQELAGGAPAAAPGLLVVALSGLAALNGTAYAGLVALLDPASVAPGPPAWSDPPDEEGAPGGDVQR